MKSWANRYRPIGLANLDKSVPELTARAQVRSLTLKLTDDTHQYITKEKNTSLAGHAVGATHSTTYSAF